MAFVHEVFGTIIGEKRSIERGVSRAGLPIIRSKVRSHAIQMTSWHKAENLSGVLNLQINFS
jgi:hypothetical protein